MEIPLKASQNVRVRGEREGERERERVCERERGELSIGGQQTAGC
jgi:hypothetical protein